MGELAQQVLGSRAPVGLFLCLKLASELALEQKKAPDFRRGLVGWKTGFEPATSGTTIQRSNQLSYNHHYGV